MEAANILPKLSFPKTPTFLPSRSVRRLNATNSDTNNVSDTKEPSVSDTTSKPTIKPLSIKYNISKSRKRAMEEEKKVRKEKPPPKKWEEMTVAEKAMELYVGEKGMLFWLNKFAYASIYIIIGGWIVFRFVGPSLGLYQLDAPPLSPADVLKGSPK